MVNTHQILANVSAGVSELKKNPMMVVDQADGGAVAILNRNEPVFYAVPAKAYEALLEKIDNLELVQEVAKRLEDDEIDVSIDDL